MKLNRSKICWSVFLPGLLAANADKLSAQVTIGANQAPDSSALLDLRATNKGILFPRVSLSATGTWGLAGTIPVQGMAVYNTDTAISGTGAQGEGFYIWTGGSWKKMISAADVTGDDLGDHTATQSLNMNSFSIYGADTLLAKNMQLSNLPTGAATDSLLTIDPATGNIRQTSPASMVDKQAWSLGGNKGTSPSGNFLGTTDNQALVLKTNNTEKMRLTTGGALGIGTSSPGAGIHLRSSALSNNDIIIEGVDDGTYLRTAYTASSGNTPSGLNIGEWQINATINGSNFAQTAYLSAYYRGDGTTNLSELRFGASNTERMRIDASGNVGIGTTTPNYKFSVAGGPLSQDDFTDGDKYLLMGASGGPKIAHDSGWNFSSYAGQITNASGSPVSNQTGLFTWNTADNGSWAERMRLAHDGTLSVSGGLKIGSLPAAAVTDSVLTADASGQVHKIGQTGITSATMHIVATSAASYTPTAADNVIIVDAGSNNVTISIPAATAATQGRYYTVKRIDSSANNVTIDFGSSHIDNATDTTLSVASGVALQFINLSITQWYTIGKL